MSHPRYLGWQMDWPIYVKVPVLNVRNKVFKRGDYFPWAEMQLDPERIATMYLQGMLYHNEEKAKTDGHGDRLGEMSLDAMKKLAQMLNTELRKKHCATEEDFKRKRCRVSAIAETQRRFIRQFLAKNPYINDYFLSIRDNYIVKKVEEPQE